MPNLLDYVHASRFDSIYEKPLNNLDLLALTELSYLPFESLVSSDFSVEGGVRLDQLSLAFQERFASGFPPFSMVTAQTAFSPGPVQPL